jgi:hypothetical protein
MGARCPRWWAKGGSSQWPDDDTRPSRSSASFAKPTGIGEGKDLAEVARHLEVSEQTYLRWRNQFGGMKADDAKRLRELERENSASSASWPTRSWRSMRSERSAGTLL